MLTSGNDITFVLSGGAANLNPNNALGGDPSSTPITDDVINNLFSDASPTETADGIEDYRCIYVFNDGPTPIYNVEIWSDDFDDGAVMQIGIESRNESQRITISGATITGGDFTLSYKSETLVSEYNSDLGEWSTALETSIKELVDDDDEPFFREVSVVAQNVGSTVIFDIIFSGLDAKRNFDKFILEETTLTPEGPLSIFITTPQEGAPINTIASEINLATTPPGGVTFLTTSEEEPLVLPALYPDEGFPLWAKRTIVAGTEALERDGFKLNIRAESLLPA